MTVKDFIFQTRPYFEDWITRSVYHSNAIEDVYKRQFSYFRVRVSSPVMALMHRQQSPNSCSAGRTPRPLVISERSVPAWWIASWICLWAFRCAASCSR